METTDGLVLSQMRNQLVGIASVELDRIEEEQANCEGRPLPQDSLDRLVPVAAIVGALSPELPSYPEEP